MMERWMNGYPYTRHPLLTIIWLIWAIVVIVLGIYGAVMMNSTKVEKVKMGATLVLIASLIALPTMWGFMIGSLLMFVGSLLGLTWTPHPQPQQPQTV
jgi:ABC-type Na+ efflux pump permease subunit